MKTLKTLRKHFVNKKVENLRKDYTEAALDENSIHLNPYKQFEEWFSLALKSSLKEPNAMALSTANSENVPTARMVLLKGVQKDGFVFYTNFNSRKANELAENKNASLLFWWDVLEKQIRIQGKAVKVSDEISEAYFSSRPLGSQIGAIASEQSKVLENRTILENKVNELAEKFVNEKPKKPAYWGGYKIIPYRFEFWQGRSSRLHDRIVYEQQTDSSWKHFRLYP